MQYRNLFCLFSLSLLLPPAWGCRLSESPHNVYQRQGNGVVYLQPEEENNLSLPEVNFKRLRRLPNSLINPATQDEWDREPPLTDLTTDHVHTGAQAIFPHFSYYSDGRVILYGGKIMRNPPGTPSVDVASFRAFGKIGVDKNSLYYEGKQTDDNGGENRVNLQSLRKVEFSSQWKPDLMGLTLRDDRFLYVEGHRLSDPDSFTVLAQKPWDQRGKFSATFNPCVAVPFGPWDTLARTRTKIMLNGELLDADPDTFSVVRWMPGSLLTWRDKNGLHRYVLNQNNLDWDMQIEKFNLQEKRVLWRKGPGCKFAEIPGLDPEQFHPLSNAVAQYQDRLYVIRKTEFGENQLDVVTLDNPNLVIDKRFNAGRHHGYLLTKTRSDFKEEDGLQVFESAGPLILMDYHVPGETEAHLGDSPHYKKWYARDDRYVYAFDGAQLWRYPTPNPKALRVKWQTTYSGYGYWVDYRIAQLDGALMEDGSFIATGIPRDPSVKTAYVKTDGTFDIGKTAVRWRKVLSPDGEWGRWQTIPNVDPSQFHLVNDRIAQYKNRLYIARLSPFGEDQLETLELDSATPFLNRKINAGKEHSYFMRDSQQGQGIQMFSINGPLKVTERFAYDNRYVYTWIGSQLYRTASPCPDKTHTLNRNVRYTNNKDIIIITQAQECQKSRR
ncbi:hypothetical protein DWF34_16980 [Salmonella enterica]|uniref:DKNYY family protein n=1 Tax=Salmonella enterica TaxID=28901 RepID=A0A5T8J3Y8_SALER|nr:hypothetical protein [Salmonella enterica]ECQ2979043.1 hypothetical protein [Salmonella enterica]EDR3944650.1 hypothetical protein [Salmonella enterica]EEI3953619.1 hypothetical protein [Salmonella enterica]EGC4958601.1 hypothetical protein [Salmonella enterica]